MESWNTLGWKGSIRIIESNSNCENIQENNGNIQLFFCREVEKETVFPSKGFRPTEPQSKGVNIDFWGFSCARGPCVPGIPLAWAPSSSKTRNSWGISEFLGNIQGGIRGGCRGCRGLGTRGKSCDSQTIIIIIKNKTPKQTQNTTI